MKRTLTGILVASMLFGTAITAFAETSTTTVSSQVQSILDQIKNLQAQLETLAAAQTQVQADRTSVLQTLKLIRSLGQGMSGADVTALQTILAADPSIYPQGTISGFFGKLTAEAVKKFQKKHGIDALGIVGPKTLKALNDEAGNLGLSEQDEDNATSTNSGEGHGKRLCAKVPPGHLIAPGWLKKNDGVKPIVPECQTLPHGIMMILGRGTSTNATSTPPDITAPVISSVTATSTTGTTTSVTWSTNESATSAVWYGTNNPLVLASSTLVTSGGLTMSHVVPISGLATSTSYFYVVVSADLAGNKATSSQNSFTTLSN